MGKAQSKLSSEELADLQKNTYCTSSLASPAHRHTANCLKVDKKELQQWVSLTICTFPPNPSAARLSLIEVLTDRCRTV
jgi:hypothetical protein